MNAALFSARVEDTFNACDRSGVPQFLGFLTPEEASAADEQLKRLCGKYAFFGGFEGAERVMLACIPDWCDEPCYPIRSVTFTFRECDILSHRDFLGSLMGLGIARETVGDILVEKGRAAVFLAEEIADYVISQTEKVGNTGVTLKEGFCLPLPQAGKKVLLSDTVASLRLDGIVAALCGFSRNVASGVISDGCVSVNSLCCTKATRTVCAGDRIAVRGKGRFQVVSVSGVSKKGRTVLEYYKYI